MASTPNIVDVTESDFADAVLTSSGSKPVLVDFWATWCRPCTMMAPVLDELAGAESDKLTVAKVDVEANQELAAEYQITAIPALLLFSEGKVVKRITGAKSKSALRAEHGHARGRRATRTRTGLTADTGPPRRRTPRGRYGPGI